MTIGDNGIITQAMKASFYQEMVGVKEIADFNNTSDFVNKQGNISNESIWTDTVSVEDVIAFPKTLKAEIVYTRENYDTDNANTYTTKEVWRRDLYEVRKTFSDEERLNSLSQELYYISGENLKKNKAYIYDSMTDVCYKIEPTVISAYTLHSMEYAKFVLDNVMDKVSIATISTQIGIVTATDGTKYYEPNLNNFSYKTKLVYYKSGDTSKTLEMDIKEYLNLGKPNTITKDDGIYIFSNYAENNQNLWANIKTNANGIDAYWTWIPRFAYKLENQTTQIIFIDENDTPIDTDKYGATLPSEYTVHDAFKQGDGLKGIWFSKYQPTQKETYVISAADIIIPDLSNFDNQSITLVYYTLDGKNIKEIEYSGNINDIEVEKQIDGKMYYWYNYTNKIWANIKMSNDGVDSYWTWIPRFAYKLETETSKVILVDINNIPIDTDEYGSSLPSEYTVHEAFSQGDGLRGIWFSKYQPTIYEE